MSLLPRFDCQSCQDRKKRTPPALGTEARKRLSFGERYGALLLVLGLVTLPACASSSAPVVVSVSLKMGLYAALGPIRDTAHPALAFPAFDVFAPNGELAYHAASVAEVLQFFKDHPPAQPLSPVQTSYPRDTLAEIAARYMGPDWQLASLAGRYTVLSVGAPGCTACEVQQEPLQHAGLTGQGVNQVILTLTL